MALPSLTIVSFRPGGLALLISGRGPAAGQWGYLYIHLRISYDYKDLVTKLTAVQGALVCACSQHCTARHPRHR